MQSNSIKTSLTKKSIAAGIAVLGAMLAVPSFAARDLPQWVDQQKANAAAIARRAGKADSEAQPSNAVLPLDHGPRATTTPWLNKQRRLQESSPASGAASTQH